MERGLTWLLLRAQEGVRAFFFRTLLQTRLATGVCSLPLDGRLEATYDVPCYDPDVPSLVGGFGNMSTADALGLSAAFVPRPVPGDLSADDGFDFVISTNQTLAEAVSQVQTT